MTTTYTGDNWAELPVPRLQEPGILDAVDANQVTITAETGAVRVRKYTIFGRAHGLRPAVTSHAFAARNLCGRVREEWATRNSEDSRKRWATARRTSVKTQRPKPSAYRNRRPQLVRAKLPAAAHQKPGAGARRSNEWNENMEVLAAWAKKRCLEEPRFRVAIERNA